MKLSTQEEITFLKEIKGLRRIMMGLQNDVSYKAIDASHRVIVQVEKKGADFYMRRWWLKAGDRKWKFSKKGILLNQYVPPSGGFYTLHKKQYEAIKEDCK